MKKEPLDQLIVQKICIFHKRRSEFMDIFRKKAIQGYDLSFLITSKHLEKYEKGYIIDLILEFVESMSKEVNEIKLNLNTQGRVAASFFAQCFDPRDPKNILES